MNNNDQFGAMIKVKISTTAAELDTQILALSSQIKQAISVKLNIDSKDITLITEKIKEAQKKAQSESNKQIKVGSFGEANHEMDKMLYGIERIRGHFATLGENVKVRQVFSNADASLKQFEVSVDRLNGKIKETSKFTVNVNINKDGTEEMIFNKITMASAKAKEAVVKDAQTKTEAVKKEVSAVEKLIDLYKAQRISAERFMIASANLYNQGKMSGTSTAELKEQTKLFNTLKVAQAEYNKDTGQTNAKGVEIQRLKAIADSYRQQEQLLKSVYSLKERIAKLNPTNNSTEIAQLEKMLQLQTARLSSSQNRMTNNGLVDQQRAIQYLEIESDLKNKLIATTNKLVDSENKRNVSANQSSLNKLQTYENQIKRLQIGFTSPATGISDEGHLNNLNVKYEQIKNTISEVRQSSIGLSNEQRRGIIQNIADLKLEIKQYQDLQRIMASTNPRSLSSNDISLFQDTMSNKLESLQVGRTDTVFARPEIIAETNRLTDSIARFGTIGGRSAREVNLQFAQVTTSVRSATNEISRINSAADSIVTTFGKDIFKLGLWSICQYLSNYFIIYILDKREAPHIV